MSDEAVQPPVKVFTIVPDINVLVSAQNASRAGRVGTISQRIMGHLTSGHVNGDPVQMAISFKMIDTFRVVLRRNGLDATVVDDVAQALMNIMRYGPRRLDPYVVFGGTPDPALRDIEDGGVLATAFAARADLLITNNLVDFVTSDCETLNTSVARMPDGTHHQLSCQIHQRPDRQALVIAHPADVVYWIDRRFDISPRSLRATFDANLRSS